MTEPDTQFTGLDPLAEDVDVAETLGVSQVSQLPKSMQTRMDRMLRRVSRRFRFEAQRIFTPGTYTHTVRIHGGACRLPEKPDGGIVRISVQGMEQVPWSSDMFPGLWADEDDSVSDESGQFAELPGGLDIAQGDTVQPGPRFTVAGNWIYWNDWALWRLQGRLCQVTYIAKEPVPEDVIDSVAAITARNLTIDPMSALPQSKALMTRHYRQELASWVSSGNVGFTDEDVAQARSYRYPAPPLIIANTSSVDTSPSLFFTSDSSW